MNLFQKDKAAKIKRMLGLRIANALGMVGWRSNDYNDAEPKFRLLHPLNWILIPVLTVIAMLCSGVPEAVREVRHFFRLDAVWW